MAEASITLAGACFRGGKTENSGWKYPCGRGWTTVQTLYSVTNCIYAITMNIQLPTHSELESSVLQLDPEGRDCKLKIIDLRRVMDQACDHGNITITQWRTLLDRVAEIQAKCAQQEQRHTR